MTHQVMNRSFAKALAVATIAFMISSAASTQAQQVLQGADGCFYTTRANPLIPAGQPGYLQQYRLGCNVRNAAGQPFYHDEINQTWTDLSTGRIYQIAADGRQYLWTGAGWIEDRAQAGRTLTVGQEQSKPISQATTQQAYGENQAAAFWQKQFREAQDRSHRNQLNFIRACSGEQDYWGCVDRDRRTNGYDCYSSRDTNTNYCQQKANARAARIRRQQQEADAKAAEIHRSQNAANERAGEDQRTRAAADARAAQEQRARAAADSAAQERRDEERRREDARRKH